MNWRAFFRNPWLVLGTIVVLLVFGQAIIAALASLLAFAFTTLAPILLLVGVGIYAFRRMTGQVGGRRH